jgi:signal peptidase II
MRKVPFGLAIAAIALDQLTKVLAERLLTEGPVDIIPGFLDVRFAENPGASFSSFQNAGPFLGIAAVGAAFLVVFMIERSESAGERAGLGLILGGALGNLVDRMVRGDGFLDGAVIDWINFRNFPTFNIADSAITIGAVILLWAAYRNA